MDGLSGSAATAKETNLNASYARLNWSFARPAIHETRSQHTINADHAFTPCN